MCLKAKSFKFILLNILSNFTQNFANTKHWNQTFEKALNYLIKRMREYKTDDWLTKDKKYGFIWAFKDIVFKLSSYKIFTFFRCKIFVFREWNVFRIGAEFFRSVYFPEKSFSSPICWKKNFPRSCFFPTVWVKSIKRLNKLLPSQVQ